MEQALGRPITQAEVGPHRRVGQIQTEETGQQGLCAQVAVVGVGDGSQQNENFRRLGRRKKVA